MSVVRDFGVARRRGAAAKVTPWPPSGRLPGRERSAGEVYMSLELIGIIAATIALGTVTLASNRGIRHELRELRASEARCGTK